MLLVTSILCIVPFVHPLPIHENLDQPHVEITQDELTKAYKIKIKTPHFEKLEEVLKDGTVYGDYTYKVAKEYRTVSYVVSKESFFFMGNIQKATDEEQEPFDDHEKAREHSGQSPVTFLEKMSTSNLHQPYLLEKNNIYFTPYASSYNFKTSINSDTESIKGEKNKENITENGPTSYYNKAGHDETNIDQVEYEPGKRYTETDYFVPLEEDSGRGSRKGFRQSVDEMKQNEEIKQVKRSSAGLEAMIDVDDLINENATEDSEYEWFPNDQPDITTHGIKLRRKFIDSYFPTSEKDFAVQSDREILEIRNTDKYNTGERAQPSEQKITDTGTDLGILQDESYCQEKDSTTDVDSVDRLEVEETRFEEMPFSTEKVLVISVPDVDSVDIGLISAEETSLAERDSQQNERNTTTTNKI